MCCCFMKNRKNKISVSVRPPIPISNNPLGSNLQRNEIFVDGFPDEVLISEPNSDKPNKVIANKSSRTEYLLGIANQSSRREFLEIPAIDRDVNRKTTREPSYGLRAENRKNSKKNKDISINMVAKSPANNMLDNMNCTRKTFQNNKKNPIEVNSQYNENVECNQEGDEPIQVNKSAKSVVFSKKTGGNFKAATHNQLKLHKSNKAQQMVDNKKGSAESSPKKHSSCKNIKSYQKTANADKQPQPEKSKKNPTFTDKKPKPHNKKKDNTLHPPHEHDMSISGPLTPKKRVSIADMPDIQLYSPKRKISSSFINGIASDQSPFDKRRNSDIYGDTNIKGILKNCTKTEEKKSTSLSDLESWTLKSSSGMNKLQKERNVVMSHEQQTNMNQHQLGDMPSSSIKFNEINAKFGCDESKKITEEESQFNINSSNSCIQDNTQGNSYTLNISKPILSSKKELSGDTNISSSRFVSKFTKARSQELSTSRFVSKGSLQQPQVSGLQIRMAPNVDIEISDHSRSMPQSPQNISIDFNEIPDSSNFNIRLTPSLTNGDFDFAMKSTTEVNTKRNNISPVTKQLPYDRSQVKSLSNIYSKYEHEQDLTKKTNKTNIKVPILSKKELQKCCYCDETVDQLTHYGKLKSCGHMFHVNCFELFYKSEVCYKCIHPFSHADIRIVEISKQSDSRSKIEVVKGIEAIKKYGYRTAD